MNPNTVRRVAALILVVLSPMTLFAGDEIERVGRLHTEGDVQLQTSTSSATVPWIAAQESGGIIYFAYASPPEIKRYDLSLRVWLPAISLTEAPTAFSADEDGFYVSFGRRTSRFSLEGMGEYHLGNSNYDTIVLFTVGNVIYTHDGELVRSLDKITGAQLDSADYWYSMSGLSVAPTIGRVFGRTTNVSPSDIVGFELLDDGLLGDQEGSEYHGDYPGADRCYVFPGEGRVVDDAGSVYSTSDLSYVGSLGGRFDDLTFYGDLPVVLREEKLFSYSNTLVRTGSYAPGHVPLKIQVHAGHVVSFYEASSDLETVWIPLSLLTPQEPGNPADPNGLRYSPDSVIAGPDDEILLFSKLAVCLFRWSPAENRYLDTVALSQAPSYIAYSEQNRDVYLAYRSGEITRIHFNLDGTPSLEEQFALSPERPLGLAAAGEFLFVCDPADAWVSHYTYDANGALVSHKDWSYYSKEYVWNEANRKMYFFSDNSSPNDLIWEDIDPSGNIGTDQDSPYHSSEGIRHPIRVRPDGALVVLGSGRIYHGIDLDQIGVLSNDIDDAAWNGEQLVTIRSHGEWTQLQKWGTNYGAETSREIEGDPIRLLEQRDGFLAITSRNGKPWFTQWTPDLAGDGLTIGVAGPVDVVGAGEEIVYIVTVDNFGDTLVYGASMEYVFPELLVSTEWSCDASEGSSCSSVSGEGSISDTVDLAPGGRLVYTITGRVAAHATSLLHNTVTVTELGGRISSDTELTEINPVPGFPFSRPLNMRTPLRAPRLPSEPLW
ncbi:MAG: hypothetical protein GY906_34570 [bacterium]|nr:hypothetical protein [bacterium]